MTDLHQKKTVDRLSTVMIAFFVLAAISVLVVYFVDPSIYTKVLKLEPATSDRYPFASTLFLVANSFSILEVPTTILQLTGVISGPYPAWYSIYRMSIAVIQVGIAIWMGGILYQYGVWGMGKKMNG